MSFLSRLGGMLNPLNTFRGIRSGVQAIGRGDARGALQGLGGATLGMDLNTSLGGGRRRPRPVDPALNAAKMARGAAMGYGAPDAPQGPIPGGSVGAPGAPMGGGGQMALGAGQAPAMPGGAGVAQGVDQARRMQQMPRIGKFQPPQY